MRCPLSSPGLFLPRQAFMFGMIYGALICQKVGISMQDYVAQIPLNLKVVHDYNDIYAKTVPHRDFSDPPASIATYAATFRYVVETFETQDIRRDLRDLLLDLMQEGIKAGLSDEHIMALTQQMRA